MSHPSFLSIVSAARVLRTRLCKFFFLIPGGEAIDVEYFGISFRVNECSTDFSILREEKREEKKVSSYR